MHSISVALRRSSFAGCGLSGLRSYILPPKWSGRIAPVFAVGDVPVARTIVSPESLTCACQFHDIVSSVIHAKTTQPSTTSYAVNRRHHKHARTRTRISNNNRHTQACDMSTASDLPSLWFYLGQNPSLLSPTAHRRLPLPAWSSASSVWDVRTLMPVSCCK